MDKTSTSKKIIEPVIKKMCEEHGNENDFPFIPGDNVINNILNYSRALSVRKSKKMAHIELVLN